MRNLHNFFFFFDRIDFGKRANNVKKEKIFETILTTIIWVNPTQRSDPIFFISTLMIEALKLQQLNCESFIPS